MDVQSLWRRLRRYMVTVTTGPGEQSLIGVEDDACPTSRRDIMEYAETVLECRSVGYIVMQQELYNTYKKNKKNK